MFKRIAHVCLLVNDLQRSLDFYAKLGFTTKFRFTKRGVPFGAYLQIAEDSFVEVFEQGSPAPAANTKISHFCLEADDLDAVSEELRLRGVPFTNRKLGCDNTHQLWLEDPDGNQFEVHQYTSESAQRQGGEIEADW